MSITANNSAPSTLAAVIGQVKDAFDAMGDATPVMVGEQYLAAGVGTYPRVVFVPEDGAGKIAAPHQAGYAARMVHSCSVYCRAAESGEDIDRHAAVYALADLVIGCLAVACSGRIEWGALVNDSPTKVDVFGAGLKFAFTFARDVQHSAARWALPPATQSNETAIAHPPPGIAAAAVTITPTATPEE